MPIDVNQAVGRHLAPATTSWTWRDVILYHLGLGAGADPTNSRELGYVYEKSLRVLPTYAVILATPAVRGIDSIPGLLFDRSLMLHGEQEIEIIEPIPTDGTIETSAKVSAVYDKGNAALTVLEATSKTSDGRILFINRYSLFMRGAGGFGGDPGPKHDLRPPERDADRTVAIPTLLQQGLIYRLSGDLNPLHADPQYAAIAGFPRPILHGLCTFGIVCKSVIDEILDGDTLRVRGYRVRFAGVVFPGETLIVRMWREGSGIYLDAWVKDRNAPALTNALLTTA